jgi:predicted enzyme involved in methoxymalonyl-ACP biosynthesis
MENKEGNIIKFPSPEKMFKIPDLSDEERRIIGITKEDEAKMTKEADRIAEEVLKKEEEKPKKEYLKS